MKIVRMKPRAANSRFSSSAKPRPEDVGAGHRRDAVDRRDAQRVPEILVLQQEAVVGEADEPALRIVQDPGVGEAQRDALDDRPDQDQQ
jgi:hypothetical protein